QRHRGHRNAGESKRRGGSSGLRRGHAGNGRADAVAGTAPSQSYAEDHLRFRLRRGSIPEAYADGRRTTRVSAKALYTQAAGQRGKGNARYVIRVVPS